MEIPKELLDAFIVSREAYLNNFWATLGSLVLAIGWFITSKDARAFLHEHKNRHIRIICSVSVGLLVLIHVIVLLNAYDMSKDLVHTINSIPDVSGNSGEKALVDFYKVDRYWVVVGGLINSILATILVLLINNKDQKQILDTEEG